MSTRTISNNTKRAIMRVKDRMRQGYLLMLMHTVAGNAWFLVPPGRRGIGRAVNDEIAELVIREVDVWPGRDGMWPGHDQTYRIGEP